MGQEKLFEHRVERWLESVGIYAAGYPEQKIMNPSNGWYFKVFGGGFQKSGIPDLIINIKGHFVAVELKAETGRPSALQRLNTNRIRDSGGEACFLYPSGFEDFKRDIENLLDEGCEDEVIYTWTAEEYRKH